MEHGNHGAYIKHCCDGGYINIKAWGVEVAVEVQKPADLARVIKNARLGMELTQQDLADAVGVTRQSIARIERGNASSSFDTVLRIFSRLGLTLSVQPQGAQPRASAEHVFPELDMSKLVPNIPTYDVARAFEDLPKSNWAGAISRSVPTKSSSLRNILDQITPLSELIREYGNAGEAWEANRSAIAAAAESYRAAAEAAGSPLSAQEAEVAIHRALAAEGAEAEPRRD